MSIGFWQIAIVVILVVLLFGRGKISSLMGDVSKGKGAISVLVFIGGIIGIILGYFNWE